MSKGVKYGAALIAVYLAVRFAGGSSSILKSGGNAATSLVKSFQGR